MAQVRTIDLSRHPDPMITVEDVAATRRSMVEASELVLDGLILRSDAKIVNYLDRYIDKRGVMMWNCVAKLLNANEAAA